MPNRRILFITSQQFGYLTDTYKYCQYLEDAAEITYLCWDHGFPKMNLRQTNVIYVSRSGNKTIRTLRLIRSIIKNSLDNYDIVFIHYFRGISITSFFVNKNKTFFDVRTAAVCKGSVKRKINDLILKYESRFFKKITVISEEIGLKLNLKNYKVLPLGGEIFKTSSIEHTGIEMIYVGTLQGRNLINFVKGFHSFIDNKQFDYEVSLTLIGDSPGNEIQEIRSYIESHNLSQIKIIGRINQDELGSYFCRSDIGISYIPVTEWFDNQPPTKTYEYLVSGMPVLGTKTKANIKIIKPCCGVLIGESLTEIENGIDQICRSFLDNLFDSKAISKSFEQKTWKSIVEHTLFEIFEFDKC